MEDNVVKIGEASDCEFVEKTGLVFDNGRIYSVERRQRKGKAPYTVKEDVTREVAVVLQREFLNAKYEFEKENNL